MLPVHGQEQNCTGTQECKVLGSANTWKSKVRRVAVDQTNRVMHTFEFKRTPDREHGYVQRCDERATEQYASLLQIVRDIMPSKGWKVQAVNFIAGTKAMNQEAE